MVTAISGSGAPYPAPTSTMSTSTTAGASTGSQTAAAATSPQPSGKPSKPETWADKQLAVADFIEGKLKILQDTVRRIKYGSSEEIERESQAMRESGAGEKLIASIMNTTREGAKRAEDSLVNAKSDLESLGFKVTGTVYEKGTDGEWRMGQFSLDAQRTEYSIHYDSSTGLTVTPKGKLADGDAVSSDTAKAIATVKVAEAEEIYAKAQAQAAQYNKLFDRLETALQSWRKSSVQTEPPESGAQEAKAQIDDFQFDRWNDHLHQTGFMLGQPLVGRDAAGRAILTTQTLAGTFHGVNVTVSFDHESGTRFRYDGAKNWQTLDAQSVDDASATLAQALTKPVDVLA